MSIVGAYVDLPKGESITLYNDSCWVEGQLNSQGPEGLSVTWGYDVPESAQVYVEWTPKVYAVWTEEPGEGADVVD